MMTDGQYEGLILTHPYHERKSCSKFGLSLHSGLGGDSVIDRWKDTGRMDAKRNNNIVLAYPYYLGKSGSKLN